MSDFCDLCQKGDLRRVYEAPTGNRGLSVYVCLTCGLVQSLPRIDHVSERTVAVSGGADWGNIRYGKGFRTELAIGILERFVDFKEVRSCLDVGANRGSFVNRIKQVAPQASIVAIEPDSNIVGEYAQLQGVDLILHRIEQVSLTDNTFDLVYCGHTLEHLRSPLETLRQIQQSMVPEGFLFLEVPNLEFIGREDVVEEWFIDKHLYHFLPEHLTQYFGSVGFQVESIVPDDTLENLTFVVRNTKTAVTPRPGEGAVLVLKSMGLIAKYEETMSRNTAGIRQVGKMLNDLTLERSVVVWGAGRLFDVLIRVGLLNAEKLSGVIDSHLAPLTPSVHGCELKRPDDLIALNPEVVLITSRTYFSEISKEVQERIPKCQIIGLVQLLESIGQQELASVGGL